MKISRIIISLALLVLSGGYAFAAPAPVSQAQPMKLCNASGTCDAIPASRLLTLCTQKGASCTLTFQKNKSDPIELCDSDNKCQLITVTEDLFTPLENLCKAGAGAGAACTLRPLHKPIMPLSNALRPL